MQPGMVQIGHIEGLHSLIIVVFGIGAGHRLAQLDTLWLIGVISLELDGTPRSENPAGPKESLPVGGTPQPECLAGMGTSVR